MPATSGLCGQARQRMSEGVLSQVYLSMYVRVVKLLKTGCGKFNLREDSMRSGKMKLTKIGDGLREIPLARGEFGLVSLLIIAFLLLPFGSLLAWAFLFKTPGGIYLLLTTIPIAMLGFGAWAGGQFVVRLRRRAEISLDAIAYRKVFAKRTIRWADLLWIRRWCGGEDNVLVFVSSQESIRLKVDGKIADFILRIAGRRAPKAILADEMDGTIYSAARTLTSEQISFVKKLRRGMLVRGVLRAALMGLLSILFALKAVRSILASDSELYEKLIQAPLALALSAIFWWAASKAAAKIRNCIQPTENELS